MSNILNLSKPISFFWEPTELCNLKCRHCYTNSGYDKELNITFEQAKKVIDQMYEEGIYALGLGGGEPPVLPFIVELIEYINSRGMNVSISTNGLLLNTQMVSNLKQAGLKIIQVSIDGFKNNHEYIRGEGNFDPLFDNIKLLSSNDIGVRVGFTITSTNYKEVGAFIEHAKNEGIEVINFFRYMPFHHGGEYLALSSEQLKETTDTLIKYEKKNVYKVQGVDKKFYITFEPLSFFSFLLDESYVHRTSCTAGRSKFNLDCDGSVSVCNYIPNKIGNIKTEKIDDIWKKINKETILIQSIPNECKGCKFAALCKGGCKGFSFVYRQNFLSKDKGCFIHLL